jgi:hypothetical protein
MYNILDGSTHSCPKQLYGTAEHSVGKSYTLWALEGESCLFPVWFCFGQAIFRTGNLFPKKSFRSKMSIDIIELFCPKPFFPIYFGQ